MPSCSDMLNELQESVLRDDAINHMTKLADSLREKQWLG